MGFGFNLFAIPALILISVFGLIAWGVTKRALFGKIVGFVWLSTIGLVLLSLALQKFNSKKILTKENYYGQYVINRSIFPGKQAEWQYKHFYIDIKSNDSIFLYIVNDNGKTIRIFKGRISTNKLYKSERLLINMEHPTHHILTSNPTTYRDNWSFYIVFNSPKFGNMYFVKDNWNLK